MEILLFPVAIIMSCLATSSERLVMIMIMAMLIITVE